MAELPGKKWTMRFDGSATTTSNGLGIVLSCEDGDTMPLSFSISAKHMRVLGDSNLMVSQAKGDFALREQGLATYRTLAQKVEQKFQTFIGEYAQRSE